MKRLILLAVASLTLLLSSCGGVYSVASGVEDKCALCFVSTQSYDIMVDVDGVAFALKTIKQKPHRANRDIKRTANNQIFLTPGHHQVTVVRDSQMLYAKEIFVSASEVKIIEL